MMGPNSPTLGNAEMKSIEMLAQGEPNIQEGQTLQSESSYRPSLPRLLADWSQVLQGIGVFLLTSW